MLWTEQFCPRSETQFHIHKPIVSRLKKLASNQDIPHLIFHGPPGSGKSTLVRQLLRFCFGPSVDSVNLTCTPTALKVSSRTIHVDIRAFRSRYHVEFNPSDYGRNDVHVVQHEMKQLGMGQLESKLKLMVLNASEAMSHGAQHALRRTMEKTSGNCRLVMCCSNLSQIIDPIKSRCTIVRVPYPTADQLHDLFHRIASEESFSVTRQQERDVLAVSDRNLRRSLLTLQMARDAGCFEGNNDEIPVAEWRLKIKEVAGDLVRVQKPKMVLETRKKLYELLVGCIPPTVILFSLFEDLVPKLNSEERHKLIETAAHYDHEIRNGGKAIFHLEAFICSILSL